MLPRSLRLAAAVAGTVAAALLAAAPARCGGPQIAASARCLGDRAYRLELAVFAPAWEGPPPATGEAVSSVQVFALHGGFGLPTEVEAPAQHQIIVLAPGDIVWAAPWVTPSLRASFDFSAPAGTLELDYDCIVDTFHHVELGWDRWGLRALEILQQANARCGRATVAVTAKPCRQHLEAQATALVFVGVTSQLSHSQPNRASLLIDPHLGHSGPGRKASSVCADPPLSGVLRAAGAEKIRRFLQRGLFRTASGGAATFSLRWKESGGLCGRGLLLARRGNSWYRPPLVVAAPLTLHPRRVSGLRVKGETGAASH